MRVRTWLSTIVAVKERTVKQSALPFQVVDQKVNCIANCIALVETFS